MLRGWRQRRQRYRARPARQERRYGAQCRYARSRCLCGDGSDTPYEPSGRSRSARPWRFAVLTGSARAALGDALARFQAERGDDEFKVVKARTKYLRSPVLVAVANAFEPDSLRRLENRDAVSAGVQNLLLGATAAGLASYWGTGAVTEAPSIKELCGFDPHDDLIALIYLGWPLDKGPAAPPRPEPAIRWLH